MKYEDLCLDLQGMIQEKVINIRRQKKTKEVMKNIHSDLEYVKYFYKDSYKPTYIISNLRKCNVILKPGDHFYEE